jgi:hypothetical protein
MQRLPTGSLARTAALIALAALAVHQLRYLGPSDGSAHADGDAGHGYLAQVLPLLVGMAVAVLASGLLRAALRRRARDLPGSFRRRAATFALAILVVYLTQETIEAAISAARPVGLVPLLAGGGWVALPLGLAAGLCCAALDHGLVALERLVVPARRRPLPRPLRTRGRPAAVCARALAASPLAFGIARRPPPSAPSRA